MAKNASRSGNYTDTKTGKVKSSGSYIPDNHPDVNKRHKQRQKAKDRNQFIASLVPFKSKKMKKELKEERDTPLKKDTTKFLVDNKINRKANKMTSSEGSFLTGGQAKLAAKAPPPNKIDAKDFAVLRAEKAKGRGMGLQDEKVQPGKVIKAKEGKKIFKGYSKPFEGPRDNNRFATIVGVKPNAKIKGGKKSNTKSKITSKTLKESLMKGKNPYSVLVNTPKPDDFATRKKKLSTAGKVASKTKIGKIALGVGTAGVALQQYLKSKMKKKDEPKKKMGGGMMKKPMGYVKGGGMDMGGPKGKLMSYVKENYMSDKDRLTNRDTEMVKAVKNIKKSDYPAAERYYKKLTSTKKMGGGMMQKPMGYKSGTMVKARGCKLGRTRPTKIT